MKYFSLTTLVALLFFAPLAETSAQEDVHNLDITSLVNNGGFVDWTATEDRPFGWAILGEARVKRVTTPGGDNAVEVQALPDTNFILYQVIDGLPEHLRVGDILTVEADVHCPIEESLQVKITFEFLEGDKKNWRQIVQPCPGAKTWRKETVSWIADQVELDSAEKLASIRVEFIVTPGAKQPVNIANVRAYILNPGI